MDTRRLIIFIVLSFGLVLLWEKYYAPAPVTPTPIVQTTVTNSTTVSTSGTGGVVDNSMSQEQGKLIDVKTDLLDVKIDTMGGDIRQVSLLKYTNAESSGQVYDLLNDQPNNMYIAQSGLINTDSSQGIVLPTHKTLYTADKYDYALNGDILTVDMHYLANGIDVVKTFTFTRDSYIINVGYQVKNTTAAALTGLSAYFRLLRDELPPAGEAKMVHTFTGPVYYTTDAKFNKVTFSDLDKGSVSYPHNVKDGWIGFSQHYFTSDWLMSSYASGDVCATAGYSCSLDLKTVDNGSLASAGVVLGIPSIASNSSVSFAMPLFVGPQSYVATTTAAAGLELTKDYGWVYIFSTPLFWGLIKLHQLFNHFGLFYAWGFAIIALTMLLKMLLYPLTRASYLSMAKMRLMTPKIKQIQEQYKGDKARTQQEMMAMYKKEKINPIGGCLPMLLQIPVFLGLYWALLSSVELRQAHFFWIPDLSQSDPYYILPVILTIATYIQTTLNPPATDPMQAKMMKIMPLAFSVMFFFFPAGLVLYWLVNNVLTMAQQYYVNTHIVPKKHKHLHNK